MKILWLFLLLCALPSALLGQDDKWVRLQTDNGEFSIEVPDDFAYLFDADGFYISGDGGDYALRNFRLLKAFRGGTALSCEIYAAYPRALDPLLKTSILRGSTVVDRDINGLKVTEVSSKRDDYYFVSRFFHSKNFVYALTAITRGDETPVMKRFFDSLQFVSKSKEPRPDALRLSTLKITPVRVKTKDVAPISNPPSRPKREPNDLPLLIVSKPRASYINSARVRNTQGIVKLRIEFAENGYTPAMEIIEGLTDGLTRQAIFAALRLKFLPAEKSGKPLARTLVVEYGFSIR